MIKLFTVALIAGLVFESQSQLDLTSSAKKRPPLLPEKPYWHYYPTHFKCWTEWFDRDDPCWSGDWELLSLLRKENPWKICPKPLGIQAETTSGLSVAAAGEVIYKYDTITGFVCRNQDQPDKRCYDYRVRFICHPPFCGGGVCWTDWFKQANPSQTGDWGSLKTLEKHFPGKICKIPLYIEAVTIDTRTPATKTGDVLYYHSPTQGFACRNEDQKGHRCRDYKIRFGCPCGPWSLKIKTTPVNLRDAELP